MIILKIGIMSIALTGVWLMLGISDVISVSNTRNTKVLVFLASMAIILTTFGLLTMV